MTSRLPLQPRDAAQHFISRGSRELSAFDAWRGGLIWRADLDCKPCQTASLDPQDTWICEVLLRGELALATNRRASITGKESIRQGASVNFVSRRCIPAPTSLARPSYLYPNVWQVTPRPTRGGGLATFMHLRPRRPLVTSLELRTRAAHPTTTSTVYEYT